MDEPVIIMSTSATEKDETSAGSSSLSAPSNPTTPSNPTPSFSKPLLKVNTHSKQKSRGNGGKESEIERLKREVEQLKSQQRTLMTDKLSLNNKTCSLELKLDREREKRKEVEEELEMVKRKKFKFTFEATVDDAEAEPEAEEEEEVGEEVKEENVESIAGAATGEEKD
ncbi:Bug1p [Sporobolomyces salmoneus]|uniref:Bug1p n=1 Tax=Sporobolomyces salmoneus TaxID=183962 RepID=UPI0031798013